MPNYKIRCEVIDVRTETGVCAGSARSQKNETYILTARTPEPTGMCGRAFAAMYPAAFAMRWTENMAWEKADHVDITCPDGTVTFRLTRIKE